MAKAKKEIGEIVPTTHRRTELPNKLTAKVQREQAERKYATAVEQVTNMAKWLTASLFAANSGGILTVLNTTEKLATPQLPGSLFATGLVFALLSGTALQEVYNRLSDPFGELIVFWAEVEAGKNLDMAKQKELVDEINQISKFSWLVPVPGWISGLLFIAAAFAIAFGFK